MRLIDADALIEAIDAMLKENIHQGAKVSGCNQSSRNLFHYGCGLTTAKEMLLSASTIDAVPVVHGKWITTSDYPDMLICSECGYMEDMWWADNGTNYCPNCGAKMDKEAEG